MELQPATSWKQPSAVPARACVCVLVSICVTGTTTTLLCGSTTPHHPCLAVQTQVPAPPPPFPLTHLQCAAELAVQPVLLHDQHHIHLWPGGPQGGWDRGEGGGEGGSGGEGQGQQQ